MRNFWTEDRFLKEYFEHPLLKDFEIIQGFKDTKSKIIIKGHVTNHYFYPQYISRLTSIGLHNSTDKRQYRIHTFNQIHNNIYSYEKYELVRNKDLMTFTCKIHGDKVIHQSNHLKGYGCNECSIKGAPAMTNEDFLKRVYEKSPDIEILEDYSGYHSKILFKNKHGFCRLEAGHLLAGYKGSLKVALDKTEYMKSQFKLKHNNKYNYPNFIYKGNREYAKIECEKHGEFEQLTDVHLMGSGCQECAKESYKGGYKRKDFIKVCRNRIPKIYVIRCWNKYENFYKIGITCRTVKTRFKDKYKMPYKYEIIKVFNFDCPGYTWDMEKKTHRKFKVFKYEPNLDFNGKYECYNIDLPIEEVKEYISKTLTDS